MRSPTESETPAVTSGPSGVRWESANCVLCGGSSNHPVLEADDSLFGCPGLFRLVRCDGCGHYFLNPRPTPDTIGRFYPDDYAPHAEQAADARAVESSVPETAGPATPWYLSSPMRRVPGLRRLYYWLSDSRSEIIPHIDSDRPRALEVGCGSGRFLQKLRESGWDVTGIEPAERPARRCRERGLHVHTGTLESVHLDSASFDAVFAWMVVEHLHDPAAALREMRRLLKPDGKLMFSVPNFACWEPRVFGRNWFSLQLPTHLHQFTPRTLRRLARQNGFRIESLIHQSNLNNVTGSVGIWLNRRFPQRTWGKRLIDFTSNPSLWGSLSIAPAAKLLAALRQGGRLTVIATPDPDWEES